MLVDAAQRWLVRASKYCLRSCLRLFGSSHCKCVVIAGAIAATRTFVAVGALHQALEHDLGLCSESLDAVLLTEKSIYCGILLRSQSACTV